MIFIFAICLILFSHHSLLCTSHTNSHKQMNKNILRPFDNPGELGPHKGTTSGFLFCEPDVLLAIQPIVSIKAPEENPVVWSSCFQT